MGLVNIVKHEKEWITCDRCGKELKDDLKFYQYGSYIQTFAKRTLTIDVETVETSSYLSEIMNIADIAVAEENDKQSVLQMAIFTSHSLKRKRIDLCADCRKDFERFMRNEV